MSALHMDPHLAAALHGDAVLHATKARAARFTLQMIAAGTTVYGWTRREALREVRRHERRVQLIAQRIDTYLRAAQTGA